MKKFVVIALIIVSVILAVGSLGRCSVCTNQGSHGKMFTDKGLSVTGRTLTGKDSFLITPPQSMRIFMESSGSMNSFLRAGVPTDFKTDLWQILSSYRNIIESVNVLSSDKETTSIETMGLSQFQTPLNSGGFVSAQSTNLCKMLRTVVDTLHADNAEVAVFVSDMEYDPVGAVAPNVLQSVYSTDVSTILSDFGYAVCLVAATSNAVDKNGGNLTTKRPYYYLILGKQECVAYIRNGISAMLNEQHHFVDNIEAGFDYGNVAYTIGDFKGCTQVGGDASFAAMKSGGCNIRLDLNLAKYRWLLANDKEVLKKCIEIKTLGGTQWNIDNITCDEMASAEKRDATASVEISVRSLPRDCDVLAWKLNLPNADTSVLQQLFTDTPNSLEQTYSIREFIVGMSRAKLARTEVRDNYIHISKN